MAVPSICFKNIFRQLLNMMIWISFKNEPLVLHGFSASILFSVFSLSYAHSLSLTLLCVSVNTERETKE